VYLPPGENAGGDAGASGRPAPRKVVGVLVTYSWEPAGEVFPVREGRNLIGRGEECDIRVANDPALSQVNSHITFRKGFVIGDMVSMGGTYVDGEPIEDQFHALRNYAEIRTGSTLWTFVALATVAAE